MSAAFGTVAGPFHGAQGNTADKCFLRRVGSLCQQLLDLLGMEFLP